MYKDNCRFCLGDNDIIVREGENIKTILSNPYLIKGHSLVMPKIHRERLSMYPSKVYSELMNEVVYIQELLMEKLNALGCDIKSNYRPFLPESDLKVDHLHFHIIPLFPNDKLSNKLDRKDNYKKLFSKLEDSLIKKLDINL